MKKYHLLFACFTSGLFAAAQTTYNSYMKDSHATPREHSVDMEHMLVEVKFNPVQGLVIGKVTHTFSPLRKSVDTLFFDAPGIRIKSASLDGKNLAYNTVPEGVVVRFSPGMSWDSRHKIIFEYEANPRRGIYFIGWNDPAGKSRKQVWTQGQGIDNRNWIPMYDDMDDKFITETKVTFDKAYKVLSNGKKVKESSNSDGTKTWHYAMSKPHAGYLLMLAIGDYAVKETKSASGVPMQFWYYPDKPEWLEPTFRHSEKMMDFLEKHTGVKYPWESYSQVMVQDFLYGAMENTTATIFGDFFACDNRSFLDRNYVGVNCHELTHQWFGDLVTARSGADTWLQESFATFYPKLFTRWLNGEDFYQWVRRGEQNAALDASKKDRNPVRNTAAGTARVYQKGSAVLDMLMYVLGEETYQRVITHYLNKYGYKNVETNDLVQSIQDVTGMSMDWFFDEWLYRGGEPHYELSWLEARIADGKQTIVYVKQVHVTDDVVGLFRMPVVFQVHYTDGSFDTKTEWIKDASQMVQVPNTNGKAVSFVLFDPGSYILKTVTFKRTYEELSAQLMRASNMIDRYDALLALKAFPYDQKKELLKQVYEKEKFQAMRAEAISQMTESGLNVVLSKAMVDPAVEVRTAVVNKCTDPLILEQMLEDSSYALTALVLEKYCQLNPSGRVKALSKTKGIEGQCNNVRIKWLECAIKYGYVDMMNEAKQDYASQLIQLTDASHEFRTRVAAMQACKSLGLFNGSLARNILDALASTNGRLSGPAAEVMAHFYTSWQFRSEVKAQFAGIEDAEKKKYILQAFPALKES